jgi:septal ring factor EnvC (AmiA/AmiB activator)
MAGKLLLAALLLCAAWGAAHLEEQWFLITEPELRSIEEYRRNSEAEKQSWQSQLRQLSARAGSLEAESAFLSGQLRNQREANRRLERSFNEHKAGQSRLLSQKDTRIAALEAEGREKDKALFRLIVAVAALGLVIIGYILVKIAA